MRDRDEMSTERWVFAQRVSGLHVDYFAKPPRRWNVLAIIVLAAILVLCWTLGVPARPDL